MEDAERNGLDIPALNEEPDLYTDLLPVWIAFGELLNGGGDISYTDIINYMNENGVNGLEDRQLYVRLVRYLQIVKAEYENKKLKKKSIKPKPKVK